MTLVVTPNIRKILKVSLLVNRINLIVIGTRKTFQLIQNKSIKNILLKLYIQQTKKLN